ncbi:MAG: matrixin family metalloprotease [bacterium]
MRRNLLISLGLSAIALPAAAYEWTGAKWNLAPGGSVPYVVNSTLSADVPDPDALAAVQKGYDVWTALPCSYMAWRYEGRTENRAWGAADGQNVASWREENWDDSPAALAIAATSFGGGGAMTDADIKFNGFHHSWAAFGDAPGGFDGRTDIASVGAHESGHCIGLGHSDIPGSTMWPSTGPGDISGRSLGADDIDGACEIYPSGGEVPPPDVDPPVVPGDTPFGEDCSMARCAEDLFCISDGRDSYCSRACLPGSQECGPGYYCAQLAQGDGACARGEDPNTNQAEFGEPCGADARCRPGLVCIDDDGQFYCTGPCANGMCPGDYFCAELANGGDICARGAGGGPLPGAGEPCTDRGLCDRGFFCLNDPVNRDEATGEVVPYCTNACDDGSCLDGFRCVDVPPDGTACQLIPSPGQRSLGDECWVNPEAPYEAPICGNGLICVGYEIVEQVVTVKGSCTKNCSPDDCCPDGWGCKELTPVFGQCRADTSDDRGWECQGVRPPVDGAGGAGGAGGGIGGGADAGPGGGGDGGGSDGCAQSARPAAPAALLAFGLVALVMVRRRRR